jgi:hypothetical protein
MIVLFGMRRNRGGLEISRNEELVSIYHQTPHKSPDEVSRIRRGLLGIAALLCRNISEIKIFNKTIFAGV